MNIINIEMNFKEEIMYFLKILNIKKSIIENSPVEQMLNYHWHTTRLPSIYGHIIASTIREQIIIQ